LLAVTAAAILIPLLYLPGYLICCAWRDAPPADALERHFERALAGALLNGWLAFTLAELGLFRIWLHLALVGTLCLAAGWRAWRRGGLRPAPRPLGLVATPGWAAPGVLRARLAAHWDVLAFAAVGLLFAWLVAQPFEMVLGVRDAGVYANTGLAIARTGAIVQRDPLVAQIGQDQQSKDPALREAALQAETNFLGGQKPARFVATGLRAAGFLINEGDLARGRVVPQHFHLFASWIALLASMLGPHGGLLATGVLGLLGLWSVGMLGRRLAGPLVGALAMLLLGLNGVQVWFSRYSTAEALTQFLCFAGLYAFAVMAGTDQRPTTNDEGRRTKDGSSVGALERWSDRAASRPSASGSRLSPLASRLSVLDRASFAALLAGLALGQWALARIDFLLIIPPLAAYLLYMWLTRRWGRAQTLLALGFGAMLAHALVHVITIARAYFLDTLYARLQDQSALVAATVLPFLTEQLREVYVITPRSVLKEPLRLPLELLLTAGFVALCFALRRRPQLLAWAERQALRWAAPLLTASALAVGLLAAYGYLVRPQILSPQVLAALPGCLAPAALRAPAGACLTLQGYVGAPIALPPGREVYTIPLANMVRVGWYLSPPGMLLGLAGFALWWRRGMGRASWLFFGVALTSAFVFFRQSYGTDDQTYIYILRRFVPQVYPALCLGAAYALAALAGRTSGRRPTTNDEGRRTKDEASERAVERESVGAGERPTARSSQFSILNSQFRTAAAALLALGLAAFLAQTSRTIYRHVEYGGVLDQLGAAAARFGPDDVLLFRGGAPEVSGGRDYPDLVTTPLTYAFGLNATAVKSSEPGHYAQQLARYVQRWQAEGRQVYLAVGASGALALPGLRLEPAGAIELTNLREFEQLTSQKPSNVQTFGIDFALYRLAPGAPAPTAALAPGDYAAQVRGFYHPERLAGESVAWTDGDALLRLNLPPQGAPGALTLRLAGGKRPASIGPARLCLSYRAEQSLWAEDPQAGFSPEQCLSLAEQPADYRLALDPALPRSATGTLLVRLRSEQPWVPASVDPALRDGRRLGAQFAGLRLDR
jgi:hypothetical protein